MPSSLIIGQASETLLKLVEKAGFDTTVGSSLADAHLSISSRPFDLVLADLELPDGSGLELLAYLADRPPSDLVIVTTQGSIETAVEALRGGAADYLTIPADVDRLREHLVRSRHAARPRGEVSVAGSSRRERDHSASLIGASPAMQIVYEQVAKVAPTDATVLITGETGTGKEVVAAALHERGLRAAGPFCPLNCGAMSPNLIESDLFGHERGSFTGALRQHTGVFERARGGTLFLDEITEMPLELQVKLLRALESREIQRIGGERSMEIDVRVIAATNREPRVAVAEGKLREDLLYRLLVFPIHLPPLRERGDDVILLAEHFLERRNREMGTHKRLTHLAAQRLSMHDWPGNVRELEHAMERAFILAECDIGPECIFSGAPVSFPAKRDPLSIQVGMSIAEAQRALTLATYDCFQEKKKTAEVLGISLKTLYTWLKGYSVSGSEDRPRRLVGTTDA